MKNLPKVMQEMEKEVPSIWSMHRISVREMKKILSYVDDDAFFNFSYLNVSFPHLKRISSTYICSEDASFDFEFSDNDPTKVVEVSIYLYNEVDYE